MGLTRESPEAAAGANDEPPGNGGVGRRTLLALATVAVVGIVAGAIVLATRHSPRPLSQAEVGTIASDVVAKAIKTQQEAPANSAVVYQQILPSLVIITTTNRTSKGESGGLGAGVIINKDGSILTAYHVVHGSGSIRVTFIDGSSSTAEISSIDAANDIAVLTPAKPPAMIVPAVLGGGGQIGDAAYAVGHPLGYVGSLTAGVISGLDRTVKNNNGTTLHGLIQFDAAINPGSSGGPLLNRSGQVIGIVTSLADPTPHGYFIGIGFAVPIGDADGAAHIPPK